MMDFSEYQSRAQRTDQNPARGGDGIVIPLLGLAGELGTLASEYKKRLRDGDSYRFFSDSMAEEIGDILWYLANIATKLGLDLGEVAAMNLTKTGSRWISPDLNSVVPLDSQFPEAERLPRRLIVNVEEFADGPTARVVVTAAGVQIGNNLTDNAHIDDGYRYHDLFHLAYMAILGWSPVMRRNLGRKRKSDPRTDEVEDGGRAIVTEESISAYVFNYARAHQFLRGVRRLDFALLDTVKEFASNFEVRERSHAEWEHAILQGFEVWRSVREHRGGVVVADTEARTIEFATP